MPVADSHTLLCLQFSSARLLKEISGKTAAAAHLDNDDNSSQTPQLTTSMQYCNTSLHSLHCESVHIHLAHNLRVHHIQS